MLRQSIFALFVLLWSLPLWAGENDRVRPYPPQQVAKDIYVIHGPLGMPSVANQGFMNNPAFVVTNQGVVVIDPGSSLQAGRMVVDQIRKITPNPITHVLNTHVHGDHWLANHGIQESFPHAIIMGHPEMIAQARATQGEAWRKLIEQATQGFTKGTQIVLPTVEITESTDLSIDGIQFKIFAPPHAHSGTDIMFYLPHYQLLFTGDNVMNARLGRADDGDFAGNIAACEVALKLPVKVIVPGHGVTGGKEVITHYKGYLETLLSSVKRLYETDEFMEAHQMKPHVLKDLAPYAHWVDFHTVIGKHISLARSAVEAASFE
uniref:Metallo-beta-lactamase domain-containing protein n=1 Tax=Magnetococcus massalia (strain MO-1) TaxID=451514 RepID=A0A1S7LNK1_MAGMO|nr:Conserved protein of unknown function. Putative Beta-lactamase domain protein [Candidatus Magnetococcus massalia]